MNCDKDFSFKQFILKMNEYSQLVVTPHREHNSLFCMLFMHIISRVLHGKIIILPCIKGFFENDLSQFRKNLMLINIRKLKIKSMTYALCTFKICL